MIPKLSRLMALIAAALMLAAPARAFNTSATAAFVLDASTGTVLLAKNADQPQPPASMSKLMTLYVMFEAIRDGRLKMDERLPVSSHAMSFGGSTMFLDTTDRVLVEDLMRGIIVLSGNDACVVVAEALSPDGTELGFSRFMTTRAQQMGMTNSVFKNSSGWPADGHVMSMRDLALVGARLISDFPEFYPMFAETEFAFDGRAPQNVRNRNPILTLDIGADGLKTGHTQEAGFGLVGSAKQGDRRVIFAINGLDTARARAEEAEQIINWAFRQFAQKSLATQGQVIAEADVWMGDAATVGLVPGEDISLLLPVLGGDQVSAEVIYDGPVAAPVQAGQPLAELVIRPEGLPEHRVPLVAQTSVERGGFVNRIKTVSLVLLARLNENAAAGS